ncbi:TIGR02281 family clan AA aspartic protease [Saccharobesus litoralis]|uniref:TIGR02281 family clan AA aspartic protease n=2 Tax=Saccharobesus litoralis TaxID=2172099 RepID=A0A2S0VY48_9ALTE|nr:TIGR02281 family clan AA aspartic protease [Saccharobesus litoralis]
MQSDDNQQPRDTTKQVGKWMYYAAWICGLLLLMQFFQGYIDQQYNPNQNPDSFSTEQGNQVILKRNRAGHYLANGLINNEEVLFLLDTGATHVSIPEKVAQRIGLRYGPESIVNTANGQAIVYQTSIDVLELGSIRLRNLRGNINPHMQGEEILLGMSALKRLEFSQRGDTLTLRQY